jgi:MoaA/NifB/PqqE/SkfB family radical SAM enzyme
MEEGGMKLKSSIEQTIESQGNPAACAADLEQDQINNINDAVAKRQPDPTINRISSVCFRVTRACNLRCPYCQAPPNSKQLSLAELTKGLRFFSHRGTKRVKFTGGEPFIYHGILQLVEECRALDMEPTIVTNGTVLPPNSLDSLKYNRARVKVSLHGPRDTHNAIQGQAVYDDVIATIRKLIAAEIETSVHTLLYRGFGLDLSNWIEFLANEGVHKVSFMTFVPRGRGSALKEQWSFGDDELQRLSGEIDRFAVRFRGIITVRCLDFARKPYIVFETDGSLGWQVAEESGDERLLQVPVREGFVGFGDRSGTRPQLPFNALVNISAATRL